MSPPGYPSAWLYPCSDGFRLTWQRHQSTTFEPFAREIRAGDRVLLNDGEVMLRTLVSYGVSADFAVVAGGLAAAVDLVALSFVRSAREDRKAGKR